MLTKYMTWHDLDVPEAFRQERRDWGYVEVDSDQLPDGEEEFVSLVEELYRSSNTPYREIVWKGTLGVRVIELPNPEKEQDSFPWPHQMQHREVRPYRPVMYQLAEYDADLEVAE